MATNHEEPPRVVMQGAAALEMPAWVAFEHPVHVVSAETLAEVPASLRAVEEAVEAGHWAAGFLSYEAAAAFDPALQAHARGPLPLAWFGIYAGFVETEEPRTTGRQDGWTGEPNLDLAKYTAIIGRIKDLIARGETYQVNFTMRLRGDAPASPWDAFVHLHRAQRGDYSAFVETPDVALCSASPELFFRLQGDRIICQPMKGTASRGRWTEEDEACGRALQDSAKDRAENVMIVDMMRNDLGRIAQAGSVRTTRLFDVQRLPTVWQMTSTVEATTHASLTEILGALFPSASVTGAPKVHTTSIIRSLEDAPRGVYTGAIGFVGPGRRAQFNVAIRTLQIDKRARRAEYGTGSGVVWDSDATREYEECQAKSLVLRNDEPFQLLTTMRWQPEGGYTLLPRHLARLEKAARFFGFRFDPKAVHDALEAKTAVLLAEIDAARLEPRPPGASASTGGRASRRAEEQDRRIRVLVNEHGGVELEVGPVPAPSPGPRRVGLAATPVATESPFLFHKTSRRRFYEDVRASRPDCDDVILWNERGEITESSIANVAIRRDGAWVTPPVSCGLLAGVMREELLVRGELREGIITREEFLRARELALFNAVRGWMPAVVA